jgi:hypothetical protein
MIMLGDARYIAMKESFRMGENQDGRPVIGEKTSDRVEAAWRRLAAIAPHQSPAARPVTPPTSHFDTA